MLSKKHVIVAGQRPSDRLPLVPLVLVLVYTAAAFKLTTYAYYVYVHIYQVVFLSEKTRSYAAALVPRTRLDSITSAHHIPVSNPL